MVRATSDEQRQMPYYRDDIDFNELAERDEHFRQVFDKDRRLDWQDPHAVQQLTKAILRQDFGLSLTLPDDRLCPAVPVRWNYVRWIQQLLDTTASNWDDNYDPAREVIGLDIGVGASCIYALLASKTRPRWRMFGTDIDDQSITFAQQNVESNGLLDSIKLRRTDQTSPLIPLDALEADHVDFTICNPPFYASDDDMRAAYAGKAMPPSAVCTGSTNEMICDGGDLGFATRILQESQQLRGRVKWYSCMLCRLASAKALVAKIKDAGITNFAAANLKAGQKTVRWAVAWSYGTRRPSNGVARHGQLVTALLSPATARTIEVQGEPRATIAQRVDRLMCELEVAWQYTAATSTGVMLASGNVWSRSARRKRKAAQISEDVGMILRDQKTAQRPANALEVKLISRDDEVELRWLQGQDAVLFESFCGMMKLGLGQRKGLT